MRSASSLSTSAAPPRLISREYPTPLCPSLTTSDDGWEVVNDRVVETDVYVSDTVLDNSFFSTNGYLGVRHRTEFSTANLRSLVNVAGSYHCEPVWHAVGSQKLPQTDEVGATACTVDLNVFIDDEQCSLADMKTRRLSMRDGVYRCECIVTGCDGLFSMRLSYRRFTSLVDLNTWCADVRFDSFDDQRDEGARGTPVRIQLTCEFLIEVGKWEVVTEEVAIAGGAKSTKNQLDFTLESRTSDVRLRSESVFLCSVEREKAGTSSESSEDIPPVEHLPCTLEVREDTMATPGTVPVSSPSGSDIENAAQNLNASGEYAMRRHGSIRISKSGPTRIGFERGSTFEYRSSERVKSITATLVSRHAKVGEAIEAVRVNGKDHAPIQLEQLLKLQRACFDAFWANFALDAALQDETPPMRMRNVLRYNAYLLFCSGQGAAHGLTVSALSCAGHGMQTNMQTYLYHGIFYVFAAPDVAKNLLLHLHTMLPQAKTHARNMSIPAGALYPHTTISGAENCGGYFLSHSPRFHINGDVAYVIFLYLDAVVDVPAELAIKLLEVVLETGRAWCHIGEWHEGNSVFRIDDVTGPDEYNGLVENSFYTHLTAKQHLTRAVSTLRQLQARFPDEVADLLSPKRLAMDEAEIRAMKDAAEAIVLHRDDRRGVYFEHQHFDSLSVWPSENIRYPLYLNYHPLVIYRHKVCAVPAVLLGLLLHQDLFEASDIRRNLEYYEPYCTHDALESVAIIASAQFRAHGDCGGEAAHLVEALAQLDLENVLYTADEGLHLSAASAVWFTIAFGVGGLRVVNSTIHLSPVLPVGWESVAFSVQWRGSILLVTIRPEVTEYELKQGESFRFVHYDHTRIHLQTGFDRKCPPRTKVQFDRGVQEQLTTYFDGVIFTLESIVTNLRDISFEAWRQVLDNYFEQVEQREGRQIAPFTYAEYINLMVYQEEQSQMSYIGLQNVLLARSIDLPVGSKADAEIVESRLGLANAKVEEMSEMLSRAQLVLANGVTELLHDLQRLGLRVALVTYTRSMNDVLAKLPQLQKLYTTKIDGVEARVKQMRGRPHADLYVKAAKKMHLAADRCVVFATNMERGYKRDDLEKFHVFFDVVRPNELRTSSNPATPAGLPQNIITIPDNGFPPSTAHCEDLILARHRSRKF